MLKERAEKIYREGRFNCAETIIHAANDEYNLGLTEDAMKMVGGFGAGMYSGQVCGALTGSVCVVSAMEIKDCAMATPGVRKKTKKLVSSFREILGGLDCRELAKMHKTKEDGCLPTILLGCEALEKALQED